MTDAGTRLEDVVLGPTDGDREDYRALVHPADADDLDTLLALADVPDVYTILQVADPVRGWRLVEHHSAGATGDGRTVFERWDVTDRELARDRSAQADVYRQTILQSGLQAIAVVDPVTLRIKYATEQLAELLGCPVDELIGDRAYRHIDRRDFARIRRLIARFSAGVAPGPTELRIRVPHAGSRWMEVSFDGAADGVHDGALVVGLRDIHHRIEAEHRLRSSEHLFRILVDHVGDGVIVVDQSYRMAFLSTAAATALGGTVEQLTGAVVPLDGDRDLLELRPSVGVGHVPPVELLPAEVRSAAGRWYDLVGHDLTDDTVVDGWVLVLRDVTERRARMERLRLELERDPLTHLLNRRGFEQRVATRLDAGSSVGIAFLDLDGFKQVNDDHGHAVGDALLGEVAARLARGVRPGDEVARFGGDEFAIAFVDLPTEDRMADLTSRLIGATRGAYVIEGAIVQIDASVGWTVAAPGESLDAALHRADQHMYRQKRGRR